MNRKLKQIFQTILNIRRALGFVWRSSRRWTIANFALLVMQGLLPVASIYLLKLLVDAVVDTVAEGTSGTILPGPVVVILLATGCIALLTGLIQHVGRVVNKEQARRVVDHMHDVIQRKAIEVDLAYYENSEYQDSLHRAQEEAAYRPGVIVNALASFARNAISLIGIAWLLVSFHWIVLVVLMSATLPGLVVRLIFSEKEYLRERSYTPKERRASYYHWLLVEKEPAKEIRMFSLGELFIRRFQTLRSQLRAIRLSLDVRAASYSGAAHVVATVLIFLVYVRVVVDVVAGIVTIGGFVMFYQAFHKGQAAMQGLLDSVARLYENNLFLTNLYEFLDLSGSSSVGTTAPLEGNDIRKANETYTAGETREAGDSPTPPRITFDNVSFTYPGCDRPVLNGVSFQIDVGHVAAIVGENGSGKSTIVKLMCRLYEPDGGRILLDGVDIRTIAPDTLRERVGVVFQDYFQYNLSVRDNIWFGDLARGADLTSISEAARLAGIDPTIRSLPTDYDTVLGRMFESGHELSIGQWQKLALARAFFRNTDLLVLDEPTSAMDPNAEYELFEGFRRILNGRTALLISHRMSTVRMADVILVIENGQVAETGPHGELMAAAGIYAGFFDRQASSYSLES